MKKIPGSRLSAEDQDGIVRACNRVMAAHSWIGEFGPKECMSMLPQTLQDIVRKKWGDEHVEFMVHMLAWDFFDYLLGLCGCLDGAENDRQ